MQEFEALGGTATAEGPEWLEPLRRAAMDALRAHRLPDARRTRTGTSRRSRRSPQGSFAPAAGGGAGARRASSSRRSSSATPTGHAGLRERPLQRRALERRRALPAGVRGGEPGRGAPRAMPLCSSSTWAGTRRSTGTPFTALNTAFLNDGAVVHVRGRRGPGRARSTCCSSPTAEAGGTVAHPRNLIVVERGARATIIESYVTLAPAQRYFTNAVTEVVVGRRRLARAHPDPARERAGVSRRASRTSTRQRDSHYRSFSLRDGRGAGAAQPARAAQRRERRDA